MSKSTISARARAAARQAAEDKAERDRSLAFLSSPNDWLNWPICPVKKNKPGGGMPELGIVFSDPDAIRFTVYVVPMYEYMKNGLSGDTPRSDYDSAEAAVDDGWRVD